MDIALILGFLLFVLCGLVYYDGHFEKPRKSAKKAGSETEEEFGYPCSSDGTNMATAEPVVQAI